MPNPDDMIRQAFDATHAALDEYDNAILARADRAQRLASLQGKADEGRAASLEQIAPRSMATVRRTRGGAA